MEQFTDKVVSADAAQTFKNRLDKFCSSQDNNYKANPEGSTSRSALFDDEDVSHLCTLDQTTSSS